MDQNLIAALRTTLDPRPTVDLRRTYEAANQAAWSPEAFEAMRQILSERGEVGLLDLDSIFLQPESKPSQPITRRLRPKPGLWWELAGMAIGSLIIPVGMFGGQVGHILLGALFMGTAGVCLLAEFTGYPFLNPDDDERRGSKIVFLWLGSIAGVVGLIVWAIMGARGELLDWWIWPIAGLSGIYLGALAGSSTYRWWSRRSKRKK